MHSTRCTRCRRACTAAAAAELHRLHHLSPPRTRGFESCRWRRFHAGAVSFPPQTRCCRRSPKRRSSSAVVPCTRPTCWWPARTKGCGRPASRPSRPDSSTGACTKPTSPDASLVRVCMLLRLCSVPLFLYFCFVFVPHPSYLPLHFFSMYRTGVRA